MSGTNGSDGSKQDRDSTTAVTREPGSAPATPSPTDPKVIVAYVCFGVGAFIIILAVIMIIIYLAVKRRRAHKKKELQRSLCLDDYKFPGSAYQLPISTISGNDRLPPRTEFPDYNFTGNGYHFPLSLSTDTNTGSRGKNPQRHPIDDDDDGVTSLPVRLSSLDLKTFDSARSTGRPSRSSGGGDGGGGEGSGGWGGGGGGGSSSSGGRSSRLAEDTEDGYVRLHRSSPLAGINAIYNSSGDLSPDANRHINNNIIITADIRTPKSSSAVHSGRIPGQPEVRTFDRPEGGSSLNRKWFAARKPKHFAGGGINAAGMTSGGGGGGGGELVTSGVRGAEGVTSGGVLNQGFVADEDFDTEPVPPAIMRFTSVRWSADGRTQRTRLPVTRSSDRRGHGRGQGQGQGQGRRHSVLLGNSSSTSDNGVYHVSLRHDGSAVTQTRVTKQPT